MFRSLGALVGDLLVVILFVAIGFLQHGTPLTAENIFLVGWPFAAGTLLGHLAIRAWNAPFRLWPHGVLIWAITIAAGMAVRTLFGAGTEASFVIVTAAVIGVGMLGWRAVATYLTRAERVVVVEGGSSGAEGDASPDADTGADIDTAGAEPAAEDADESGSASSAEPSDLETAGELEQDRRDTGRGPRGTGME